MNTIPTPQYKKGKLDPESLVGFATITEYVVLEVLRDAKKEKFCAPYDLFSKSLGRINVKSSFLHRVAAYTSIKGKYERAYWMFAKPQKSQIPDYYLCLGFDKYQTEIIRVWKIPGNSEVVAKNGISISMGFEDRLDQYALDPTPYNNTFQEMDIKSKPEFRNTTKPKVNENRYINKKYDLLHPKNPQVSEQYREWTSNVITLYNDINVIKIREAFYNLSKTNKRITLSQVKETSGVDNPSHEIDILKKAGIIIQVNQDEFMWV